MGASFQRRELTDLLHRLDNPECPGIFVLGGPGTGKTVLLQQLEAQLQRQGRDVFAVRLVHTPDADLTTLIRRAIERNPDYRIEDVRLIRRLSSGDGGVGRTQQGSTGSPRHCTSLCW
jgi:Cdc6-like AAA superfamily ATPase